ncbi:hypothetical protein BT96DRAFT_923540 [Gymnopus androsaceus JB14]|uniref:Uncharacterized protein n=1 Tax=Gymnopus androsaceus JB14 TaxID=1447944 RepID=A0A6A4HB02_9AGAR|nr:hypothetical protein BT96DRAFT_923539 [Gymnopus androsaceus JB14]KAE9394407.1 hypothetical protein BT96DRAFT_923540 [Gymnopus androsaceus JB14]
MISLYVYQKKDEDQSILDHSQNGDVSLLLYYCQVSLDLKLFSSSGRSFSSFYRLAWSSEVYK